MGAAEFEQTHGLRGQAPNGDERRYPTKIWRFTKGLPHDDLGQVDLGAYRTLRRAIRSGHHGRFESVALGGSLKLVNPQAESAWVPWRLRTLEVEDGAWE